MKMWLGALASIALAGCGDQRGVTFADSQVNRALPKDYSGRTMIANTADYRFNLAQNVGAILEEDPGKPGYYRLAPTGVILPPGFRPEEQFLIKEDNAVFSSKVVGGLEGSAQYGPLGVNLLAKQAADLSIVDISRSEIPTNLIPAAALAAYAATMPERKRYWVKSLLLSRIIREDYHEQAVDAKGSGPAFGAAGKVYGSGGTKSNDYALAVHLIDLDAYRPRPGAPPVPAPVLPGTSTLRGAVELEPICAQPRGAQAPSPDELHACLREIE
jgi:hypothetical protein